MKRVALLLLSASALGPASSPAASGAPLEPSAEVACPPSERLAGSLPNASDVRDPLSALLIGLLDADRFGCIPADALAAEVRRSGRRTVWPYRRIRRIARRAADAAGPIRVAVELDGRLELPIPYRILWLYRPGTMWSDASLRASDWPIGTLTVAPATGPQLRLEGVHLLRLEQGRAGVDIDAWLDRLMGGRLDDMTVGGVALFRCQGRSWAMAIGQNPRGARRFGLFDLTSDEIVFPAPEAFKVVARQVRVLLEAFPRN